MISVLAVWLWPALVLAGEISATAKIFDIEGNLFRSLDLPALGDTGADFTITNKYGDKKTKFLFCRGSGVSSVVEVYDLDGQLLSKFSPFNSNFKGGCLIEAADLKGDGYDEIVVSAGSGGGPQVGVFSASAKPEFFWAFASTLRNGARVWSKDLGWDGQSEIIIASHYNQAPEIILFGNDFHQINSYKIPDWKNTGLSVAVGDFDGNGQKELAVSGGYGNAPAIRFYSLDFVLLKEISYHRSSFLGGLNLSAGDFNNDGRAELVVTENFNGSGEVSLYDYSKGKVSSFDAYHLVFSQGVKTKVFDYNQDGKMEIITLPASFQTDLKSQDYKFITVDLKQQKLYRYQDGQLLDSFLISSGKSKTPTPIGDFSVFKKRPKVWMSGIGYSLPNVPWVASFKGPYTIHGTYWHSNFGRPMSHGCVNMRTPEAKKVYDWSEIGTPVIIY